MSITATSRIGSTNGHQIHDGVSKVKVTPEMARKLLERNKSNRKVKRTFVERYAQAMKDGEWKYNGESIKIGTDGTLLDGQHRLLACVESGVEFETLVIGNLSPATFAYIDIGRKRTGADVLDVTGFKYTGDMAAALNLLRSLEAGWGIYTGGSQSPTNAELVQVVHDYPGLEDACAFASSNSMRAMLPRSLVACLLYEFRKKDHDAANEFFLRLKDGVGLEVSSPIRRLREKLLANMASKAKLPRRQVGAILIKAWNAFVSGKTLGKLSYGPEEDFPAIVK